MYHIGNVHFFGLCKRRRERCRFHLFLNYFRNGRRKSKGKWSVRTVFPHRRSSSIRNSAESGYEIKEIQTEDLKEKIAVTNSSNVTFEMPSNKVHLKPVFRKTEVSEKNPDEKESMDQEPAKDLKADERREQKMKQILKEIGVGFAEESEVATFDLARAAGETINTGAVKKNIGQIDVVDYNTSDWKFLMTWKEGKLGNTSTGEEKM